MAYDPATAAMAETLEQFNIGADKGADVPKERKWRTWTDEDRKRYFKWDSIALPIPITNKRDLHQFGDLLKGLGTKLQYLAARGDLDDLAALLDASLEIEHTKRALRRAGKIPTKKMLQENKKRVSENDY